VKEEKRKRGRSLKRGRDIVEDDGRCGELVRYLVVNDDQDKYLSTITIILLLLRGHCLIWRVFRQVNYMCCVGWVP